MNKNYKYSKLEDSDDVPKSRFDERYAPLPQQPKGSAIVFAVILMIVGMALITLGSMHYIGHFFSEKGAGLAWIIIGILVFIPGFFYSRIAFYSWRKKPGFSFDQIPHMQ